MSVLGTRRAWVVAALVAGAGLSGWAFHRARWSTPASRELPAAGNALEGVVARDAVGPALAGLGWDDIGATAAGTSSRSGLRREVVEALSGDARFEAKYLRALLLLTEARPDEALALFNSIPMEQIPPLHLYAPYRLHGALRPGIPNPYREPLVAARRSGRLPPLIAGRVAVAEGDLRAAVEGYIASDPGQWTSYDLSAFRALLLHAGLAPDTRTLLAAVLRGTRVPARIRSDIEQLLAAPVETSTSEKSDQFKARLMKLLTDNPAARQVAVAAATEQLRVRQLFVSRDYAALVQEHRAADLTSMPDATLVLVLVSASQTGDGDFQDRCVQELRRRYSGPQLERWLAAVKARRS